MIMMFNATFNNILVISWPSVLLVKETGVPVKTSDLSQTTDKVHLTIHNFSGDRHWLHRYIVVVNPTTMRSRLRLPPIFICL